MGFDKKDWVETFFNVKYNAAPTFVFTTLFKCYVAGHVILS